MLEDFTIDKAHANDVRRVAAIGERRWSASRNCWQSECKGQRGGQTVAELLDVTVVEFAALIHLSHQATFCALRTLIHAKTITMLSPSMYHSAGTG